MPLESDRFFKFSGNFEKIIIVWNLKKDTLNGVFDQKLLFGMDFWYSYIFRSSSMKVKNNIFDWLRRSKWAITISHKITNCEAQFHNFQKLWNCDHRNFTTQHNLIFWVDHKFTTQHNFFSSLFYNSARRRLYIRYISGFSSF